MHMTDNGTQSRTEQKKSAEILKSIRSMIVLYGSVRSTPLARNIDRSLLDLPLVNGTLSSHHLKNARACESRFGLTDFELRFLVDTESEPPKPVIENVGVKCVIQQDASSIRGVAGALSDATKDYDDDEYIIVSSGAQVFMEPLDDLVHAMAKKEADVAFVSSRENAPVGVWLIRCGVLKSVKPIGYVDLKEQALDDWKQHHKVFVVERPRAYAHPARSLVEYLSAIRADAAGYGSGKTIDEDPYREDWESAFSIVETEAVVAESAVLHDSIALNGSSVGKDAIIVRSVICDGAVVGAGARVTDKVLTGVVKKGRRL
jgi:NDP-sugar pyrophosphorylase family protein